MPAHFKSWEEAKAWFDQFRRYQIDLSRFFAIEWAAEHGTVHSRSIRPRQEAAGLFHPDIDERWIGAVFSAPTIFEWTGKHITVEEASPRARGGGGGGRPVREWRLVKDAIALDRPDKVEVPPRLMAPKRPKPAAMMIALGDLRAMTTFIGKVNREMPEEQRFRHKDIEAAKELGEWLRFIAAGFDG